MIDPCETAVFIQGQVIPDIIALLVESVYTELLLFVDDDVN